MLKDQKQLYWFLGKGAVIALIYNLLSPWLNDSRGAINDVVTLNLAQAGAAIMRVVGYDASVVRPDVGLSQIAVGGNPIVHIEHGCNGIALMVLFAGFILAYPGPWRKKLWYIPAGVVVIHLVNILRVAGLAINHQVSHSSFEFNHKYTFLIIVYAFVFWLWMIWANRLARINDPEQEAAVAA